MLLTAAMAIDYISGVLILVGFQNFYGFLAFCLAWGSAMFSYVFQMLPHSMKIFDFWLRCPGSSSAAPPRCSSATDAAQRTAVAADAAGGTRGGTGDGRAINVTGI